MIRGRLMSLGAPVGSASTHVRSYDDGWANVKGARVTTNDEGRYRVRIDLVRKGDRLLLVVANPSGDAIRNSRAPVLLQVGPAPRNP